MTILPTGECFDDAVAIIAELVEENPGVLVTDEYVIVHAVVAPYGEDMAHAWVESKDTVQFIGIVDGERVIVEADRIEFYENIKAKDWTKYTIREAYQEERRTGECGPWEEKYQQLCKD